MTSESRRPLYKGQLLTPKRAAWSESYTVDPISKDHIRVKNDKNDKVPVIEFSSGAVPMPFLDPSIISRRIQEEREWKAKEEKEKEAEGSSQRA